MPFMGGYYDKSATIPIVCIINNSAELSLDDNKAINEAIRNFYEILLEKSRRSRFCEVKISVIGLSGEKLILANNCDILHFYWDDHKTERGARWDEAIKCLDDQLFEYMRHLRLYTLIYRPIVLFFTTSASIPSSLSLNLKRSASIKDIVTMFVVTPEANLENGESLKKIIQDKEYVVKTSEMERLKELIVFSKTKSPLIDMEFLHPLDNARFLIRSGSDSIDVVEAFSLTCCQVGSCEPTIANEVAFEIKPLDDCVEIMNKWKDYCVSLVVEAGSERTIKNCFDAKFALNISSKNESSHELNLFINKADSTITVENTSSDKCTVRLAFPLKSTLQLKDNDRIVDTTGAICLAVEEIKYDDHHKSSDVEILDKPCSWEDEWD